MPVIKDIKPTRLLRLAEVTARTALSRGAIYAQMRKGTFPKNVSLTDVGRSVAWIESEIDAWVCARVAVSRAPDAPRPFARPGPGRGHKKPKQVAVVA